MHFARHPSRLNSFRCLAPQDEGAIVRLRGMARPEVRAMRASKGAPSRRKIRTSLRPKMSASRERRELRVAMRDQRFFLGAGPTLDLALACHRFSRIGKALHKDAFHRTSWSCEAVRTNSVVVFPDAQFDSFPRGAGIVTAVGASQNMEMHFNARHRFLTISAWMPMRHSRTIPTRKETQDRS
jgi:hypothetical protein